jgi:hypothetical protein
MFINDKQSTGRISRVVEITPPIIPKEYIQTFKNIVYEFLWKGKKDPVKQSVLSNDYLEGGLKMTNIDTYIKALQIKWIFFLLMRCFSGSSFLLWLYIY